MTKFPVLIDKNETIECEYLNERVCAYSSLKKSLRDNAQLSEVLGYTADVVNRIDIEEREAQDAMREWWGRMSSKYDLPHGKMMDVDFGTSKITLVMRE